MFFEDAEVASKELELVLTGRDCGLDKRAPMCGIPYHSASSYISRLISKGYKVAIGEQLEDPSAAKGIVKRDIIKIITPGTYTDSSFLEENKNNFIMSIHIDEDNAGLSFCDVSTGEFISTYTKTEISIILNEISKFNPSEILVDSNISESFTLAIQERFKTSLTFIDDTYYNNEDALQVQFLDFNPCAYSKCVIKSSAALLTYIIKTQNTSLSHIDKFEYYHILDFLSMDINSRKNLELTETLREKSKKGSLLWVLDKTSTSMGGRQLRKWVEQPLVNKESINNRLDAIEEIISNISLHEDIKESLKSIYDIERIVGKISSKNVNAKELIALKNSIGNIPAIKQILNNFNSNLLKNMYLNIDELSDIYNLLEESIVDNPSLSIKEGNIIKSGYSSDIDSLRDAKAHGKEWISKLEAQEKDFTGIKSLKVGYNKVFGYFIEVTKSNISSIPEGRYIRKQTLSNAERYITPELKEMEEKILGAEEKLTALEYDIFLQIRSTIENEIDRMKKSAHIISELDCLSSLTTVALENNYCKPSISDENDLSIIEGRHPVVEKMIPTGSFISNDTLMDTKENQMILITGPNMAGKSTYMRQVALITIMAQIGSFVPAKSAKISICDKIFTRIGASDDLAAGKSTFMVEMWEVANILQNATNKSLVLLDEVGRGTSTFDGLSIAWSVIEHICENENLRCKTLFATHYHELIVLENKLKGVKNFSVSIKKINNELVFLRKIIQGGADESYGIEVAKLAGLPDKVIERAKEILTTIEKDKNVATNIDELSCNTSEVAISKTLSEPRSIAVTSKHHNEIKEESLQLNFTDIEKNNLLAEIASIDIMNVTPIEGFNKLYEIIKKAKTISKV